MQQLLNFIKFLFTSPKHRVQEVFMNRKNRAATADRIIYSNAIDLAGQNEKDWLKIVPLGVFPLHPNGPHEITTTDIVQMAENFNAAGTDLLFDYEHHSLWGDSKAAGWSDEVEAREDGLYCRYPQFTPAAESHINAREYRYLSPVYQLGALDKSGREIGSVLLHVGLTNVPYLDSEIDPIGNTRMSKQKPKTNKMKLTSENLKKLGLDDNATDEQINAAIANSKLGAVAETPAPAAAADLQEPGSDLTDRLAAIESRMDEREQRETAERAEVLVNSAVMAGKILPAQKKVYLNAAKADYDGTKEELDGIKANSVVPGALVVNHAGNPGQTKLSSSEEFHQYINQKRGGAA